MTATNDEIRAHLRQLVHTEVWAAYDEADLVFEHLEESARYEAWTDLDEAAIEAEVASLLAEAREALARHEAESKTWSARTANDRLTAAFLQLDAQGIIALEDAGVTLSDGWSDVAEARELQPEAWGATFFHRQDVERVLHGGGLYLAFGAFAEGSDHESESVRLAAIVCQTLDAAGLPTRWDGTLAQRIEVLPFRWQRRRGPRSWRG